MAGLQASLGELREVTASLEESAALLRPDWWRLDEDPPRKERPAPLRTETWSALERRVADRVAQHLADAFTDDDAAGRAPQWHAVEPPCCGAYTSVLCLFDELQIDVSLRSGGGRHLRRAELLLLSDLGFGLALDDWVGSLTIQFDPRRPEDAWQLAAEVVVAVVGAIHHADCGTSPVVLGGDWSTFPCSGGPDEPAGAG